MTEIGFLPSFPNQLRYDNKSAINISEKLIHHNRMKHVEVDQHFIKEKEDVTIELPL